MLRTGRPKPLGELRTIGRRAFDEGQNVTRALREHLGTNRNTPEAIEVAYDLQAGSYVEKAERQADFFRAYGEHLAKHLEPHLQEGDMILDAGTGEMTNLTHMVLALKTNLYSVHGCDISQKRINLGRQYAAKFGLHVHGIRAELSKLPFPKQSFDVVTTSHAIEPNGGREREILKELLRVTKRKLVLFEPCFEIASEEGKARMIEHGYVKGLSAHAEALGATVESMTPLEIVHNPLNPTACWVILP